MRTLLMRPLWPTPTGEVVSYNEVDMKRAQVPASPSMPCRRSLCPDQQDLPPQRAAAYATLNFPCRMKVGAEKSELHRNTAPLNNERLAGGSPPVSPRPLPDRPPRSGGGAPVPSRSDKVIEPNSVASALGPGVTGRRLSFRTTVCPGTTTQVALQKCPSEMVEGRIVSNA